MKKIIPLIIAFASTLGLQAQECTELFISEYVEGTHNNKAIELYNPTNETIDLSKYALSRWSNGSTNASTTTLEGAIQPYSTFVIVIDKRDPNGEGYETPIWNGWWDEEADLNVDSVYDVTEDLESLADVFINPDYNTGPNTMYFNGNDAVSLETIAGDLIDIFGKIGENPGDAWGDDSGAWWTKDQTLVRKSSITNGFIYDNSQPYEFDPTLEWDSLPANTFSNLGSHVCDCNTFNIEEDEASTLIYPNPNAIGELNVETKSPISSVRVYNILGENVSTKNLSSSSIHEKIQLNRGLKGIYFVEIQLENKERIIKQLLIK